MTSSISSSASSAFSISSTSSPPRASRKPSMELSFIVLGAIIAADGFITSTAEAHPQATRLLKSASAITQGCTSPEFGERLFAVTSSHDATCLEMPNQEGSSFLLKVAAITKFAASLFSQNPTASDIEKATGIGLEHVNDILRHIGYDLQQKDSSIRAALSPDRFNEAEKTMGEGWVALGEGLLMELKEINSVGDAFFKAFHREIQEPASPSSTPNALKNNGATLVPQKQKLNEADNQKVQKKSKNTKPPRRHHTKRGS